MEKPLVSFDSHRESRLFHHECLNLNKISDNFWASTLLSYNLDL